MKAQLLTEKVITDFQLPAGKNQDVLWDTTVKGFGVRVLASGARTFIFQYRPVKAPRGTPARMLRIGAWPTVKVAAARQAAHVHAGEVAQKKDPAAEKAEVRRRETAQLKVLLAMEDKEAGTESGEYEQHLIHKRIVNRKAIMRSLRRGLAGLMAKDVAQLTREELYAAIYKIEAQGKPGAAADLRKFIHRFCEWACKAGKAKTNAIAGIRKDMASRAERLDADEAKARALSDAEIVTVWNACEHRGVYGRLVRMLLLTGCRRSEIAKLTHEYLLDDRLAIRAEHSKTSKRHEVALTPLMRGVLAEQYRTTSPLVFPSERANAVFKGWSLQLRQLVKDTGIKFKFSAHDLRRTCRTLMDRLGVEEIIGELAIGHKRTGVAAKYNLNEAWELRCQAFAKVDAHIAQLLRGNAVVADLKRIANDATLPGRAAVVL